MPDVYVIDDHAEVLQQVARVLEPAGYDVWRYLDPGEFVRHVRPREPGALLLDLRLPGMTGLEVQAMLRANGVKTPVVFLSENDGPADIIAAMKADAVDVLLKPFTPQDLKKAVEAAILRDRDRVKNEATTRAIQAKQALLSGREHDAYQLIIRGYSNKEIAAELDVKPDTAKKYRAVILAKFKVNTLAQLLAFVQPPDRQ